VIIKARVKEEGVPFRRMVYGVAVMGILSLASCRREEPVDTRSSASPTSAAWFEEVADEINVEFVQVPFERQRFYLPEITTGGEGLFDYDGDGDLDIYFVQGGDLERSAPKDRLEGRSRNVPGNKLFRNRGDGSFEDVTEAAGVGDTGYGMGCACGDYDGDGDVDLYVTNVGPNALFRNNGDGTFTDVTLRAGVGDTSWGSSSAFVDYDGDGLLDLFLVNYITWSAQRELNCRGAHDLRDYCHPKDYQAPAPDTLYHNNGDGTFTDVSNTAGMRKAFGNGLGIACGDFDNDGRMDVYVANDEMANQLWMGDGRGGFKEEALLGGCAFNGIGAVEGGMGVMAVDVENDGDADLFIAHFQNESNTFYRNQGGTFDDVSALSGLGAPSQPFTGFGLGFADFDHDGYLDVFIANGRVTRQEMVYDPSDPYAEPNLLFRGGPDGRFSEVVPNAGTTGPLIKNSRGAAFGDIDNDGDIDIVVVNLGGGADVLRNVVGARGKWVMFRVMNSNGSDAIGASVRITTGGREQWRTVQTAYSYCASNDPRVHFGLGDAKMIDEVLVRWPVGRTEKFGPFLAGKHYVLTQGQGRQP
jgi:hypothetical protein